LTARTEVEVAMVEPGSVMFHSFNSQ
jgi:hypothetical protein